MAIVDIDRHILTELILLNDRIKKESEEFTAVWDLLQSTRAKIDILMEMGQARNGEMKRLRNSMEPLIKSIKTKMIVMDDAFSKSAALLQHLVTKVIETDKNNGYENICRK